MPGCAGWGVCMPLPGLVVDVGFFVVVVVGDGTGAGVVSGGGGLDAALMQ